MSPVAQYTPPEYPTNADAKNNPALLKKLPSRWRRNAAAAACVGLMGTMTLAGCPIFPHHGGAGGAPIYVVHLTEQEALSIIRSLLEDAGLNFDNTSMTYVVQLPNLGVIPLDLFDMDKDIGVTLTVSRTSGNWWGGSWAKQQIEEAFSKQWSKLTVGVFDCPGQDFWTTTPNDSQKEEAREKLKEHLSEQVSEFIKLLQHKGIL